MKKLLILLSPLVFTIFIGCGGGDDQAPPPVPPQLGLNNPNDQQALMELQFLANKAKKVCTESYSPMFLTLAMGLQGGSGVPPQLLMPQKAECPNAIDNLLMSYVTLAQGRYANTPETRPWLISQISGIVNRIGGYLQAQGVRLTPKIQQQLFVVAGKIAKEQIAPQVNPGLRAPACAALSGFGAGC